jgi:hypothetical protein
MTKKKRFFPLALVRRMDASIFAHVGNAQSLGVDSILDGSDSAMELPLRPRDRQG